MGTFQFAFETWIRNRYQELGVMRDPKNQFKILTTAKIWLDTSEIFDIETKILAFWGYR
jgi:hypothetical protein